MLTKKKLYYSVDIEKPGCTLYHPIRSVGLVLYDSNNSETPFSFYQFNISAISIDTTNMLYDHIPEYKEETIRCKTQFWNKYPGLWESFDKDAKPEEHQSAAISKFFNDLYRKYSDYEIIGLSDNPAFDFGHLDYYLNKYATINKDEGFSYKILPTRMEENGTYHCIQDPSERVKGLLPHEKTYVYNEKAKVVNYSHMWPDWHPHNPVYDAMQIMLMQLAIDRVLENRKHSFLHQFITVCVALFHTVGGRGTIIGTERFTTLFTTILLAQFFGPFTVAATVSATILTAWTVRAREHRIVAATPFCLFVIYYTLALWVRVARDYLWQTSWLKAS